MKVILFSDKKIRVAFALILMIFPVLVSAGGLVPCGGEGQSPCELCHLFVLFDNIVIFVLRNVVPSIAVLMLIFGGIMFYISAGDPEKMGKAKRLLISTIVGMFIVYFAWGIVVAIFTALGATTWKDGWYTINCG